MYQFPYTNFHDLDLDWILNQVKNAVLATQDYQEEIQKIQPPNGATYQQIKTATDTSAQEVATNTANSVVNQAMTDVSAATVAANTAATAANTPATAANTAASSVPGLIASTFSTTSSYVAGQTVYYDGALYRFTADHSAGAWTGSDVTQIILGDEVGGIQSQLDDVEGSFFQYGDMDILWLTKDNRTDYSNADISLTWSSDKRSCTVTGSNNTSSLRVLELLAGSATSIPAGITLGYTYKIKYNTTDSNVPLTIYYYKNGVYDSAVSAQCDTYITIPNDITGMRVFISVRANATVNNVTVSNIGMLRVLTKFNYNEMPYVYGENLLISPFNDILPFRRAGVTYTYDERSGTYTVAGTSESAGSFYRFYNTAVAIIPYVFTPGERYLVSYNTTDSGIKFQFNYKVSDTWSYNEKSNGAIITIPSNATEVAFRLYIEANTTVNGTVKAKLTKYMPQPVQDPDDEVVQVYTDFTYEPMWYKPDGTLANNAGNTLYHTNKVKVKAGAYYYMAMKYSRGSTYACEGAFFDANGELLSVLLPDDLLEYEYQIPNADADSTLTNYIPLYRFRVPAGAHYFSYNATMVDEYKYRQYIANIPVYRHEGTGNLIIKQGDPAYQYFGKRKLCVIGPSTVMIDRLLRTGNFENDGESQSQYVVGFQEYLIPYWKEVASYGYSSASYAKYDIVDGADVDSIYTQIVTGQVDLSGYDDFLFVQSTAGLSQGIGTVTSYSDLGTNTTYIGALRQIIAYIYTANPQAKIYIQTSRRYGAQYSSDVMWDDVTDLNTEIRKMAGMLSCQIIDMDIASGFNQYTTTKWCYDATNPSTKGHWNHIGSREVGLFTRKAIIGY